MNKKAVKGILDIILVVTLALMYSKNVISMAFHEIGGLALCGLFLIHKGLNWDWIKAVGRKFTGSGLSCRTRLMMILDIALLVSFLLIAISGLCISKVVINNMEDMPAESAITQTASNEEAATGEAEQMTDFPAQGGRNNAWKTIHYFCSALALLIVGVHAGLHSKFIAARLRSVGIKELSRPACAVMLVIALGLGVYGITQTSFTSWLSMPFRTTQGEGQRGIDTTGDETVSSSDDESPAGQSDSDADTGSETSVRSDAERMGGHGQFEQFSFTRLLSTLAGFAGIMALVGTITALIDKRRACLSAKRTK
ncbi:MAG: DUF4405 domain-containing protein [Clostridia bacterium]|nr:DUF4405 domain-containing protein [Clostridia bacterium]